MVTANHTPRRLSRADRSRRIFELGGVHPVGNGHGYLVDSDSGRSQYRVEVSKQGMVCVCLDW